MNSSPKNKLNKLKKASALLILLFVISGIALIATVYIVTAKPVEKIAQINNSRRSSDTGRILNAIHLYTAENHGIYPKGMPKPGEIPVKISQEGADICPSLVPKYLSTFPSDPIVENSELNLNCSPGYDTGYTVSIGYNDNRVTVTAPNTQPPATSVISVTR